MSTNITYRHLSPPLKNVEVLYYLYRGGLIYRKKRRDPPTHPVPLRTRMRTVGAGGARVGVCGGWYQVVRTTPTNLLVRARTWYDPPRTPPHTQPQTYT